jgi:predicted  nucleic acid-binding Zn-ribbon protein
VRRALAGAALILAVMPAQAQDIRGLENCAAEKQMERRTGCLQANTVFLQQALAKLARETQQQLAAANRETAAAKADSAALRSEIAALKEALGKLAAQVEDLRAAKPAGK